MPSEAKILIVDDHEDTLYALESALAPLGYRLTRATSGDAALKQVLRSQVGLNTDRAGARRVPAQAEGAQDRT